MGLELIKQIFDNLSSWSPEVKVFFMAAILKLIWKKKSPPNDQLLNAHDPKTIVINNGIINIGTEPQKGAISSKKIRNKKKKLTERKKKVKKKS